MERDRDIRKEKKKLLTVNNLKSSIDERIKAINSPNDINFPNKSSLSLDYIHLISIHICFYLTLGNSHAQSISAYIKEVVNELVHSEKFCPQPGSNPPPFYQSCAPW